MTQELETISGSVENIVYRNEENGYTVLEIGCEDELITAVGQMADLCEGEEVVLHGNFKTHATFGQQFSVA